MVIVSILACSRQVSQQPVFVFTATPAPPFEAPGEPIRPAATLMIPTPDPTRPATVAAPETYVVQPGDTLSLIAEIYGVTVDEIMELNGLADGDVLSAGQTLILPGQPERTGPDFKVIPDSELVYGPRLQGFDVGAYVRRQSGFLASYVEEVDGELLSGADVVGLIARQYGVSPRLLLALLEYRGEWLSNPFPPDAARNYPLGLINANYSGLYRQLEWAANNLNAGYYGWRYRGLSVVSLRDGTRVALSPSINAGTAAIQYFLAQTLSFRDWLTESGPEGFYATFVDLFGDPFTYAHAPLLPPDLSQPPMELPWAPGEAWYYTGGPHGGWGRGSGWAAIDFAPPDEQMGCYVSEYWARAVAPGVIADAGPGFLVLDLDMDGYAGTGWSVFYLHLASDGKVAPGTVVNTGDPLGRPSCEGGVSTGTHLHIARRYNGEWIPADCYACSPLVPHVPFVLSGWMVEGIPGQEYQGYLRNGSETRVAEVTRSEINELSR